MFRDLKKFKKHCEFKYVEDGGSLLVALTANTA